VTSYTVQLVVESFFKLKPVYKSLGELVTYNEFLYCKVISGCDEIAV